MELVAAVTVAIAPCTPALFIGIKFELIKGWIVDQNNFLSLCLAIVNLLFLIFCYFGLSNLTVEPTFKLVKKELFPSQINNEKAKIDADTSNKVSERVNNKSNEINSDEDSNNNNTDKDSEKVKDKFNGKLWTIKDAFARNDVLLILLSQAFLMSQYVQIELNINISALQVFGLTLRQIGMSTY